ncbi:hypothetical protein P22_0405 [Propionispora sp. 2/2-37]|uniref:nicotinate-nucleotide--dimethylbenzimidazole phosphoribosyltransferase n=1 Tax=Propionispora sp. 2/2-37 TaxID=1677858 RepID=UPI0006BB7F5C|nr:nicotinate-nucleotide--dimethylbenzimidazole phosphoribosyltransferase [Propionispora sp. 2/2-37]CUH94339.1 hypothetical protein P22_0405 [Propionispora sp. 2/2-37]
MDFEQEVDAWINGAAKPPNSLGLLEKHVKKLLLSWGTVEQELRPHHLIYAADNGVVEEGVVNYPPSITWLQAQNMVAGRAAISCFCHYHQIPYSVVDIGINHTEPFPGVQKKVALGTKNFVKEEAMSRQEFAAAWEVGTAMVNSLVAAGQYNLISFGEMGIGNTTTSSAVLHALTGIMPEFIVGSGAGLNSSEALKHKRTVVARGVALHRENMKDVKDILRCVGGFDIVAICAGMVECSRLHIPFVIDGFITAVAYVCAARLDRNVERQAIPSHMSKEPGMATALLLGNIVAEDVVLRANMALGEGTGAVLMVGMLKTMLYTLQHMARLADMGVTPPAATEVPAVS